jgi:pimeloyl-ACP methyl ester carboxylesterase
MSQIGRWNVGGGGGGGVCGGGNDNIVLSYCIFRPRQLHDVAKPPLVVIHGGPSIPSNYLLPIVNGVTDRTVIFYDQWGCGKSSRPSPSSTASSSSPSSNDNREGGGGGEKSQRNVPNIPPFSVSVHVEHFRQLVEECWKLTSYHLLGHSWGGILAYEYLKMKQRQTVSEDGGKVGKDDRHHCRSLILASTPTSAQLVQEECKTLLRNLQNQSIDNAATTGEGCGRRGNKNEEHHDDDDDANRPNDSHKYKKKDTVLLEDDDDGDTLQTEILSEEFRQTHECRLPNTPLALMDATAQAGPTPWRGIPAISHYVATTSSSDYEQPQNEDNDGDNDIDDGASDIPRSGRPVAKIQVPTMLLRGEYDFCTDRCMLEWTDLLTVVDSTSSSSSTASSTASASSPRITTLTNCSHYAMLEDERQFGKVVSDFIQLNDRLG